VESNEKCYYLRSLNIRCHSEKFSDGNGKEFKLNFVLSYSVLYYRAFLYQVTGIKTNKIRFVYDEMVLEGLHNPNIVKHSEPEGIQS